MKKLILLLCLVTTITTNQAFAWSVTIGGTTLKGDDPKPIPDIIEWTKKRAEEAARVVRDAVAAVGNATGISNIVDSNKKVFVDIGSGYACLATLCYSEVVKKKQLEEAEQEAQDELDRKVAAERELQNRLFRHNKIKSLEDSIRSVNVLLGNQNSQLSLAKKENLINAATLKALSTQMVWNEAMAGQGIKENPPLESKLMNEVTDRFEQNFNRDYTIAINQLNFELEALAFSQKRTHQDLMSEVVYLLKDSSLRTFTGILEERQNALQYEIATLEAKIKVNQAKLKSTQASLDKERGS